MHIQATANLPFRQEQYFVLGQKLMDGILQFKNYILFINILLGRSAFF